jgi:D-glycero-alpha-D-manno-heptose 1-phosphate guanylyltransferase
LSPIDILILCGGKGTRLHSVTQGIPKAMVSVGEKTFLDHLLEQCISWGCKRIILCTGYGRKYIRDYYSRSLLKDKIEIFFSEEITPLGTAGALKSAEKYIQTPRFLVINGDTWLDLRYSEFVRTHIEKKALLSIAVKPVKECGDAGVLLMDDTSYRIKGFFEKKGLPKGLSKKNWINSGVYLMNRSFLTLI